MSTTPPPEHLRRYPCMQPWIGSRYRDERHKRLLVIGESHYLPPESTIHHDPERWYCSSQADLSDEEVRWASTIGNITGRWTKAHRIYRAIQDEIVPILKESGITPGPLPPQPHRLLQLLPPPGADGRRQHGRQRMPARSRRGRGRAPLVHPEPLPGAVDRHLTLRWSIRSERVAGEGNLVHQYAPSRHPLVEHRFPELRACQRTRPVSQFPEEWALAGWGRMTVPGLLAAFIMHAGAPWKTAVHQLALPGFVWEVAQARRLGVRRWRRSAPPVAPRRSLDATICLPSGTVTLGHTARSTHSPADRCPPPLSDLYIDSHPRT